MTASSGQTGKMRILLNILAVIIGLPSGFLAVAGSAYLVVAAVTYFQGSSPAPAGTSPIYFLIITAGFSFLGFLIASRALLHLRQPDAGTARDMIGTAIYLIVITGIVPLFKSSSIGIPIIIGLYVFHRYLVKRIAARAFPAPESQP